MTTHRFSLLLLIPLFVVLTVVAGLQVRTSARVVYGEEKPLGDGTVRTFVSQDRSGRPMRIGIVFSEGALRELPDQMPPVGVAYETVLALPSAGDGRPFDHVTVGWNPVGHAPESMYARPHFDVRFYLMTGAERTAIDPMRTAFEAEASRHPDAAFLPPNHVPAPGAVPNVGNHWVDASVATRPEQPFRTTFIYGTWNGDVTFLEPMATRAYMQGLRAVTGHQERTAIPQPAAVQRTGYYPTAYTVRYDEARRSYAIVLEGLRLRTAVVDSAPLPRSR